MVSNPQSPGKDFRFLWSETITIFIFKIIYNNFKNFVSLEQFYACYNFIASHDRKTSSKSRNLEVRNTTLPGTHAQDWQPSFPCSPRMYFPLHVIIQSLVPVQSECVTGFCTYTTCCTGCGLGWGLGWGFSTTTWTESNAADLKDTEFSAKHCLTLNRLFLEHVF